MNQQQELISSFSDILSLLYHEGRNVRHLSRIAFANVDLRFMSLRDGFATNRYEAWAQIQPLRREAAEKFSARLAERVFERQFGLTLDDLVSLYADASWRGTGSGGNAWLPIAKMATQLGALIDEQKQEQAAMLVESIFLTFHNTGRVGEKLGELDAWWIGQDGQKP